MTPSGQQVWHTLALPKIHDYYSQVLQDFSLNDTVHAVHYLLKILHNMQRLDQTDTEETPGSSLGLDVTTENTP